MAILRNLATRTEKHLLSHFTVGREASCELQLSSLAVSTYHARIEWTGANWVIRDLGSRNGTTVNKKLLLGSGSKFQLHPGDEIVFGDPEERWSWVDGSTPAATAVRADGTTIEAQNGMLLLPDEVSPCASVFVRNQEWRIDTGADETAVKDGAFVEVGGERFCLRLPPADPAADHTQTILPQRSIVDARISFFVSMDEEHVRTVLESDGRSREVTGRAFHYMLLQLARQRLEDRKNGVPESEAGWKYRDELAEELAVDMTTLNVHVCRAKRAAGFQERKNEEPEERRRRVQTEPLFKDAHEVVERRAGQIRLGVREIFIGREDRAATPRP